MIKVTINYQNNLVNELLVEGHSNYANKGKDIVCAGVSAIIVGGINAITSIVNDYKINYEVEDGFAKLSNLNNSKVQEIINVVIIQLKTVEDSYSRFIKIVESYQ